VLFSFQDPTSAIPTPFPLPSSNTTLVNVTRQAGLEAQMSEMRSQITRYSVDANKRAQADSFRQTLLTRLNQPGYNVAHLPADLNTVAQGYNNNPIDAEANRISAELFEYARTVARVSDPNTPGSTCIPPHLLIPSASQYLRDLDSAPTSKTEADLVDRARGIAKLQKDLTKLGPYAQAQAPIPFGFSSLPISQFPFPPPAIAQPPFGHMPIPPPPPQTYQPPNSGGRGRGFVRMENRECYNCGGRGHIAQHCPHPLNSTAAGRGGRAGRGPPNPPRPAPGGA
jgi:hypothetical protein